MSSLKRNGHRPLLGRMAVSSTRCQYRWLSKHLSLCNWFYFVLSDMIYPVQPAKLYFEEFMKSICSAILQRRSFVCIRASGFVTVLIKDFFFTKGGVVRPGMLFL